jgi:glycerate kinase
MKKCLILPDSFKGTMCAAEVCDIMSARVRAHAPHCEIHGIPIADGGEGTVDCFLRGMKEGESIHISVKDPFFRETRARYARMNDVAVIEVAAATGLDLARPYPDPKKTSSYGVGQMIAHAAENGCRDITVGLGGSCTNDAGAGMAAALGARFYDAADREMLPVGETLADVVRIDTAALRSKLSGIRIRAMCDITNPLYGSRGAAYVFAPQKGAAPEDLPLLDRNLRVFADTLRRNLGIDVGEIRGGGAAGGMGAGIYAFLGAELVRGIDAVLDMIRYETLLVGCDFVFTGEGRFDAQSLDGKAVVGIGLRARNKGVPVIAVVGSAPDGVSALPDHGITRVCGIAREERPLSQIKLRCREDLAAKMDEILSELD